MGMSHGVRLGLALLLGCGMHSAVQAVTENQIPIDRFIVKFKQQPADASARANPAALGRLQSALGVKASVKRSMANGAVVVAMSESRRYHEWFDVMTQLAHDGDVAYIEPDLLMEPTYDPLYSQQWYLNFNLGGINIEKAWDYSVGNGAVIAVLDSGIRPHVDLVDNIVQGYDFITDTFTANDGDGRDNNPLDPGDGIVAGGCGGGMPLTDRKSTWHGTHVAGIAAAPNNGIGITGVAYEAKVQPIRVLGRCGGYTSDIVDAIYWAAGYSVSGIPDNSTKADVINMSLSATLAVSCGQSYQDAITAANAAGVTVVTSAGNTSANAGDFAPGNCSGVVNVTATNYYGDLAYYSNTGAVVDVAAPGGEITQDSDSMGIWSTLNSGEYAPGNDIYYPYQGTSMAAPQVAAAVALMRSVVPDAAPVEIEAALKNTTRDFFLACAGCGTGILDSEEAVKRILGLTVEEAETDLAVTLVGDNGKFIDSGNGTGTIQYTVVVTNKGPDQASDLVLSNVFPPDVTLERLGAIDAGMICSLDDYSCRWSEQEVGASRNLSITVRTSNQNKMTFAAGVSGGDTDPVSTNNYVSKKFGGGVGMFTLLALLLWQRRF